MRPPLQSDGRQSASPGMWLTALLCALLMVVAGTAQASHVHGSAMLSKPGHAMVQAPAEDCPWCAAAQVAMPAAEPMTVALLPRVEGTTVRPAVGVLPVVWCPTMWSRPPPAEGDSRGRRLVGLWDAPEVGV